MKAYKGFNKDLQCTPGGSVFQYELGKSYEKPKAELCKHGFHACEAPLNVWDYYPPIDGNRFCEVELDGVSDERGDDTKVTAKKITIGAELGIPGLVKAHVEYVKEQLKECGENAESSSGDWAKIGSSGDWAKIGSSGDWAQIGSSGDLAQIGSSGDGAKIGSSGDWAKIGSSGDGAKIGSSGDGAKIGSSGDGAKIGSSGDWAQIGSSGDGAKIGSSGDWAQIGSSGDNSVIMCAGHGGVVKAKVGSWFTLSEWANVDGTYKPICVKTAYVDGETIKANTWYKLENGEFVEVE